MPSRPGSTLLDEALDAWADARGGVIAELENIPARRMVFRPAPDARSVAELVQHIIESALMWSGELTNDLKQRFEREARTVAALNHLHICTLHDIDNQDGIDFLVMEYLDGQTLAQRLEKGTLLHSPSGR